MPSLDRLPAARVLILCFVMIASGLCVASCDDAPADTPLVDADDFQLTLPAVAHPMHAHNDYYHQRPLFGALQAGTRSIEVDVFPRGDHLMVAHDRHEIRDDRTFSRLYAEPLARLLERTGAIYPDQPDDLPVILLVDFKGDPDRSLELLVRHTRRLADALVRADDAGRLTGRLLVVVSGNTPRDAIAALPSRDIFVDGRLPDLQDGGLDATVAPLVSSNWSSSFTWRGRAAFPDAERDRLHDLVERAHARGQHIRFWAAPDDERAWSLLHDAGVDLINTDRPERLGAFLAARDRETAAP